MINIAFEMHTCIMPRNLFLIRSVSYSHLLIESNLLFDTATFVSFIYIVIQKYILCRMWYCLAVLKVSDGILYAKESNYRKPIYETSYKQNNVDEPLFPSPMNMYFLNVNLELNALWASPVLERALNNGIIFRINAILYIYQKYKSSFKTLLKTKQFFTPSLKVHFIYCAVIPYVLRDKNYKFAPGLLMKK